MVISRKTYLSCKLFASMEVPTTFLKKKKKVGSCLKTAA
jgi:hypothetical protein